MNDKEVMNETWGIKILDLLRTIAISLLVAIIFTTFFFKRVSVIGSSMNTTLIDGDQGFSNVISTIFFGVERYDVVAVNSPEVAGELWVKRVIGLPGDTLSYQNGVLTINGEVVEETYITLVDEYRSDLDFTEITLGENEYFLMGDNRNHSKDSRFVGAFGMEDIVSKDIYIFYPFSNAKVVK